MGYYNMQGPAQYQQHQQSRKDQQMSQMLQMMMQMRAFKQRQKQFDVGQETSQRKQDWREKYQQQYMDYQKFQMDPVRQRSMAEQRELGKRAGEGPEIEPPRPILPVNMISWMRKRHGYTREDWDKTDDTTRRQLINQWELETKPEKPTKPTIKPQFEKDYTRIKSLLGRYDKERTRYLNQVGSLPEIDPEADQETQRKVIDAGLKTKTGMINIETAIALLVKMQDAAANGQPLTEKELRQFKRLININKVKQDGVILATDVPPGTPIASNKQGEQVALIENQWVPILA